MKEVVVRENQSQKCTEPKKDKDWWKSKECSLEMLVGSFFEEVREIGYEIEGGIDGGITDGGIGGTDMLIKIRNVY